MSLKLKNTFHPYKSEKKILFVGLIKRERVYQKRCFQASPYLNSGWKGHRKLTKFVAHEKEIPSNAAQTIETNQTNFPVRGVPVYEKAGLLEKETNIKI